MPCSSPRCCSSCRAGIGGSIIGGLSRPIDPDQQLRRGGTLARTAPGVALPHPRPRRPHQERMPGRRAGRRGDTNTRLDPPADPGEVFEGCLDLQTSTRCRNETLDVVTGQPPAEQATRTGGQPDRLEHQAPVCVETGRVGASRQSTAERGKPTATRWPMHERRRMKETEAALNPIPSLTVEVPHSCARVADELSGRPDAVHMRCRMTCDAGPAGLSRAGLSQRSTSRLPKLTSAISAVASRRDAERDTTTDPG